MAIVILRKMRGRTSIPAKRRPFRLLDAGLGVIGHPLVFCERFSVGHPHFPTVAAGVFHAWYGTRLAKEMRAVGRETRGAVTDANYLEPLQRVYGRLIDLGY